MDAPRFDRFAVGISASLTRRTGVGLLAGACLPLLGLAGDADAKKKKNVTLCFNGQTLKRSRKKAKKLLKKGATKGACPGGCAPRQKRCGNACIPTADCCVDDDCTGANICENGDCMPLRCGNGGPCTVFLTAAGFTGAAVGGLSGGDAKCQAAASAAGLTGTFRAWLSAGSETPGTRFTSIAKAGPYRLVRNAGDGANLPPIVAENFNDLFTCGTTCLNHAIDRDENGVTQGGSPGVWTGTHADGVIATDTCSGWTSTGGFGLIGQGTSDTTTWTQLVSGVCAGNFPLYCFQQAT